MNRRLIVARIVSVTGSLLLIVAAIHLLVTPALKSAILDRTLTPQELRIVSPPFLLNHIVVGILLIPLGFISLYTASGIRAGERWAWVNQPCHRAYHPQPAGRAGLSDARGVFSRRSLSNSSHSDNNSWDYNDGGADISPE
jgi:hypothetical protein